LLAKCQRGHYRSALDRWIKRTSTEAPMLDWALRRSSAIFTHKTHTINRPAHGPLGRLGQTPRQGACPKHGGRCRSPPLERARPAGPGRINRRRAGPFARAIGSDRFLDLQIDRRRAVFDRNGTGPLLPSQTSPAGILLMGACGFQQRPVFNSLAEHGPSRWPRPMADSEFRIDAPVGKRGAGKQSPTRRRRPAVFGVFGQ
jgi:hypothetical protein